MNILFLTQSGSLALFYDVAKVVSKKGQLDKAGFYLSDSRFYNTFKTGHSDLVDGTCHVLKEWEIIGRSKGLKPNLDTLKRYEALYGDPALWNALTADRRIFLGKKATIEQDYPSRFQHERMMAVLEVGIGELEQFFDRVKPDLVIGFICVTIGEYIAHLIAKKRGIQFLNLRPTRIKNFIYAGESVHEPSERLEKSYRHFLLNGIPDGIEAEVVTYLEKVRKTHAMYEGVIPARQSVSKPGKEEKLISNPRSMFQKIGSLIKEWAQYNLGDYRHDNSHPGVVYPLWVERIKRPMRNKMTRFFLRNRYSATDVLKSCEYVFFPLHKEPEVTLLVYSRAYLNQIEVVRNIARSLPVGMKLVIKEHPGCIGYRSLNYYRRLLEIPNVMLVPPEQESREIIENATLVSVISGSIGLEALMMKKPVIHLGNVPFSMLPDRMIRHVSDINRLDETVFELIREHEHDEKALIAYLAAVMSNSVGIDFYSILLGRKSVYSEVADGERQMQKDKQVECLTDYIITKNTAYNTENDVVKKNGCRR
jgi:hypothetical protein